MARLLFFTTVLALLSHVHAQCGAGTPDARVTGSGGSFTATKGSSTVYTGPDYRAAIQAAVDSISSGQRVSVMASGSIGATTIAIGSGKIFEGCGTINVGRSPGRGAIEVLNTVGTKIPYLTMTGLPNYGLRIYGAKSIELGQITMNLDGGRSIGIRFDRDAPPNSDVVMDVIRVTGSGSHAVETWNIDGLKVNQVIARDVGECGLLLQNTRNTHVNLVDGINVGTGTGYATLRMANRNGRTASGGYETNNYVKSVVSRGGGRGFFCVSESGGAVVESLDLANNGGDNSVLIENCYNLVIQGGKVIGGGQVRVAARDEFANTRDISVTLEVDKTSVLESPCAINSKWMLSGDGPRQICAD